MIVRREEKTPQYRCEVAVKAEIVPFDDIADGRRRQNADGKVSGVVGGLCYNNLQMFVAKQGRTPYSITPCSFRLDRCFVAGSVNKVILIGNLGKDPEVRSMQNGGKVCNLSIATSEGWKDKMSGERKEKTEWHRVVIFNENLITVAERYLKKGSKVYLEGQIETRKWSDQSGVEKYSTEVVLRQYRGELTLLDSREGGGSSGYSGGGDYDSAPREPARAMSGGGGMSGGGYGGGNPGPDLDDEIPF